MKNNIKITVLHSGSEADTRYAKPIITRLTGLNTEFPDSIHIWVTEQRANAGGILSGLQAGQSDEETIREFLSESDVVIVLLSEHLSPYGNEFGDPATNKLALAIERAFQWAIGRPDKHKPSKQDHKVYAAQVRPIFFDDSKKLFGYVPELVWRETSLQGILENDGESAMAHQMNEFVARVKKHIQESREECIRIAIPAWVGYISCILGNDGLQINKETELYKKYKIGIEFRIIDDFELSVEAWKRGDVHMIWATPDLVARNWAALKAWEPTIVYQSDWSRGADNLLVRPGIKKVADLRGKTVLATKNSPGEALLRAILKKEGIEEKELNIVLASTDPNLTIKSFIKDKGQTVHGIVTSSPFDQILLKHEPGLRELFSTASPGFEKMIADVLIANRTFCETHLEEFDAIFSNWFAQTARLAAAHGEEGMLIHDSVAKLVDEILEPVPAIVPDEVRDQIHAQLFTYFSESLQKIALCGEEENREFLEKGTGDKMVQFFFDLFPAEAKPSWSEMYLAKKLLANAV